MQCNQAAYTVNPLLQNIYVYKLQIIYVHNIIQQARFMMQDEFSNVFISKYNTSLCMSSCNQTSAGRNNDEQQAGNYDHAVMQVSVNS